jgi:hypothetical protein
MPIQNAIRWTLLPLLLACSSLAAAPPDLADIDRTIQQEPTYQKKPGYCLLVFGPRADTRVWLIQDGETLYVDCNANGDLAEAGESFRPIDHRDLNGVERYRDWKYEVGDLTPAEGTVKHTRLKLTYFQKGGEPAAQVISVLVNGAVLQYAGWGPLFALRREEAPVIHFGGPVVCRTLRGGTVSLSKKSNDLHLCFGTPGLGKRAFAFVGYEAVPEDVRPTVEIEWPAADPGSPAVRTKVTLDQRC